MKGSSTQGLQSLINLAYFQRQMINVKIFCSFVMNKKQPFCAMAMGIKCNNNCITCIHKCNNNCITLERFINLRLLGKP